MCEIILVGLMACGALAESVFALVRVAAAKSGVDEWLE